MAASEHRYRAHSDDSAQDGELEQYGVWVKAGPDDVDEQDAADQTFAISDLGDAELDQDLTDEIVLDLDEADEEDRSQVEPIDLDEFSIGGNEITLEAASDDDLSPIEFEDLPPDDEEAIDLTEEVDLEPDFGADWAPAAEPAPSVGGARADAVDALLDEDLIVDEQLPSDLDDLTLDLESLDVDSFSETGSGEPEPVEDLPLSDDDAVEELLLDVDEETSLPEFEDTLGEEIDLPEFQLDDISSDATVPPPEGDEPEPLDVEPLADLDIDLDAELPVLAHSEKPEPPAAGGDRSLTLLQSIESELSSIRAELAELKQELSGLRAAPARKMPDSPADGEPEADGGFFAEEDDDEKIALTGSELDNILQTAEFTEETGQPTELDEFDALSEESGALRADSGTLLDEVDILPDVSDVLEDEFDLFAPEGEQEGDGESVFDIVLDEAPDELDDLELDLSIDSIDEMPTVETPEPPPSSVDLLAGTDDEVEALATLDIDAELSGIEELEDTTDTFPVPEPDTDEPVYDAEPLDLPDIDLPPEPEPGVQPEVERSRAGERKPAPSAIAQTPIALDDSLKDELRSLLPIMDQLLEALPEETMQEFAQSEHFSIYEKLFKELGLEQQ